MNIFDKEDHNALYKAIHDATLNALEGDPFYEHFTMKDKIYWYLGQNPLHSIVCELIKELNNQGYIIKKGVK